MKYIKGFDYIVENKRNAKRFKNKGGLMRNDQFSGNVSLSKTLADELGFDLKKEYSEGVGFDNLSMYDTASGKTIIEDALSGKHTYDDLVKIAKEWYKKNESAEVNEGFSDKGDIRAMALALKDGKTITARHARFPASFTVLEINPKGGFAKVDYNDGKGAEEMAAMNIDPKSIKISESVNEAKKLGLGDKGVDYNDNVVEIIAIGNYNKIAKMLKKETGNDPEDYGYEKAPGNYYLTKNIEATEGNVGDVSMYPVKYDMANYWGLDPVKESLTEAKKFKPGDMWSSDFDYEGMLRYGLKVNEKTPIKMLNKLFDSATDVNYHTPFRNLGIAIDWIEDGDKKGAKDYIKNFHDDIKKEMKDQGIK